MGRKLIPGVNDLATVRPDLADEWHPTKNDNLTPQIVPAGSSRKFWWLGKCGHEWYARTDGRAMGAGCPYCGNRKVLAGFNDLATTHPHLAAEWHPTKNGDITPESVSAGCDKKVWWRCDKGHEWESIIYSRKNGASCPYCAGRKVWPGFNDLASMHPNLAVEWHPTKNGKLSPKEIMASSHERAWWKCSKCGHEWSAVINERSNLGSGCPCCSEQRISSEFNNLATLKPDIAAQWHPTKNGDLTPEKVTTCSPQKVWWKCKNGHEWEAKVCNRTSNKTGCPYCSGKRVMAGFNDLATVNPEIAAQWHPFRNGDLTPQMVTARGSKKVWWKCKNGHEWEATIAERSRFGCPYCSGNKVLAGFNDLASINPQLATEWHPTKNGALTPDMVSYGSNKMVWWICKEGHEWQASVCRRNHAKAGCPYCAGNKVWIGFNDLATKRPDVAQSWHPTKNGTLTPQMVTASCSRKLWWRCEFGHEWQATVYDRTNNHGCPHCQNGIKTSFPEKAFLFYIQKLFPKAVGSYHTDWLLDAKKELDIYVPELQLAVEYDGYNHTDLEKDLFKNRVCKENGVRLIRIREPGIPEFPKEEEHLLRNGLSDRDLELVIERFFREILHIEEVPDINISRDRIHIYELLNLPKRKNSLMAKKPELAAEWHSEKNGDLTPFQITYGSKKRVWWQCLVCGHEWEAAVVDRSSGRGCPSCGTKKRSRLNNIDTHKIK